MCCKNVAVKELFCNDMRMVCTHLHTHQDSKPLKPNRSNCSHQLFSNVAAPTSIKGANVSQHMPFSRIFSIHILQRAQAPQLLPVDMQHAGQFTRQQEHRFTARPL